MDDWLTILLAFVFIVLPMLEGLLKKSKKKPAPRTRPLPAPSDTEAWRAEPGGPPLDVRGGGGGGGVTDDSWSDGWGSWPGEDDEDDASVPVPEPVGSESNRDPRSTAGRTSSQPATPQATEIAPIQGPVPAEAKRLQDLADHLNRIAAVEADRAPSRAASRPPVRAPRRVGRRSLFSDRSSVRHAIIVSEVLGKPLAMRPPSAE